MPPVKESLRGRKPSCLENKSPGCFVSADLSDPPISLPSTECSPFIVDTASLDIELVGHYPEATTAPGPGSEIPAGMHATYDASEEEEWPSDENLDEISSSTGTTIPGMSLAKYSASTNKPFPRPPTLVARRKRDSTVPTNLRQRLGSSLALLRSCATRPPAIDAVIWALPASWHSSLFDNRIPVRLPSTPPPLSRLHRLALGAIDTGDK